MTTDEALLDVMLADLAAHAQRVRDFQCQSGQDRRPLRKLAASTLHTVRNWRHAVAGDTVSLDVVVEGQAARADTSKSTPSAHEEPLVPVSPQTSIRIPEPLRERVAEYGRERRWSMGEVTRVALEQLVGQQVDTPEPEPRQTAA